jgi:DEAD/DEAH box helicase domain-containing protein
MVLAALARRGIERPWRHQVEAAQAAYDGRHVVVVDGHRHPASRWATCSPG